MEPVGDPLGHAAASIAAIARWGGVCGLRDEIDLDPAVCLFGRAGSRGWHRRGRVAVNGSCRLMPAPGGWVAVNLARPDDVSLLLALAAESGDPWPIVERLVANTTVIAEAAAMGIPVAVLGEATDARPGIVVTEMPADETARRTALERSVPLVVDLSAMWAGPLCAKALGTIGCRVVKVESPSRPDAVRAGDPRFFDWLHNGHESVALDLRSPEGAASLHRLVAEADIVVESARPRAMAQLGIDPCAIVQESGCTWVEITGHGRVDPASNRVAFGDDAAVAGGLVAYDHAAEPVFCGDAIADPLTGLAAAAAALKAMAGGGGLVDVAMSAVAADAARTADAAARSSLRRTPTQRTAERPPRVPDAPPATPFGRDTERVLAELHVST